MGRIRTAIVSMPFYSIKRPSIQLGLLSAIGNKFGFDVDTYHLNVDFAASIGAELYENLAQHRGRLLGDWLFSQAAFGSETPSNGSSFLDEFQHELTYLTGTSFHSNLKEDLLRIRSVDIPNFLDSLLETVDWNYYDIVAFTSTFQQNTASFALAKRLKQTNEAIITLFGGANFDGEMGLEFLHRLDYVDYVVSGEGDNIFPAFIRAIEENLPPEEIPGVFGKKNKEKKSISTQILVDINDSPIPDYSDYFDRILHYQLDQYLNVYTTEIPFESSRGCWWGEKHHCTFCGLNASTMKFRRKNPEIVFNELITMSKRYQSFEFQAVDNIIDMNYLGSLVPVLIDSSSHFNIFYETKSNLTKDQLKLMAESGINKIQPGIESLSSNVLNLMKKGVKGLQNVNFLKWASYYKIKIFWNILWGFPGEKLKDYEYQVNLVPKLVHFPPPSAGFRIWMERFSPIYFDTQNHPTEYIRPEKSYEYIYPHAYNLDKIAYFFDYQFRDALDEDCYYGLHLAIENWRNLWGTEIPYLTYKYCPGFIQIQEGRPSYPNGQYTFHGVFAELYVFCCDRQQSFTSICQAFPDENPEILREILIEYDEHGLMASEDDFYLSLAHPIR